MIRADVISSLGGPELDPVASEDPAVCLVTVRGPLEQRAGYHEGCGGWTDGHDAIAERLCAALCEGDVVLVVDSPGGAHAGLQEAIRRVVACKEAYGRRITAYADEMIGSAAYWWTACVADEIYLPEAGIIGSIGARAAHASTAGQLAKEGVEVTYFAAPGAGKVAFAPELPLSELGKQRGERDVWIAFEAFAAAVSAARGISRDEIIALDADSLTGQAAVDAGLADGVASLEDVLGYALEMAKPAAAEVTRTGGTTAKGHTMEIRSEQGPESPEKAKMAKKVAEELKKLADQYAEDGAAEDDDAEEGADSDGDSDGGSDGGGGGGSDEMEEAKMDDEDEEEAPPSSKPMPPPARMAPPPAKKVGASVAALFGLRDGASAPAVKSAALPFVALANAAMSLTGTRSPREAEGALRALADDAADAVRMRNELRASKQREARRERMDLLRKLASANLPGYTRGECFVDVERDGKIVAVPAPMFGEMKLGTLRGLVQAKLATAPTARAASPYQPSQAASVAAASTASADLAAPQAAQFAARSTAPADKIAAAAAALAQMGAFSTGN